MSGQERVYIVSERSGPGTGDRIYIDQKGRAWVPVYSSECGTGDVIGRKVGDRIYPNTY
jgi:hypothetical protein